MKKVLFIVALCAGFWPCFGATKTNLSNGVIAIVDNTVITYRDLNSEMQQVAGVLASQFGSQPDVLNAKLAQAEKEILEQLIERQLILHEFKVQGYKMPENFIEEAIRKDIRDQFGDRLRLTKTLQENGDTYENYRERTKERIIVQSLTFKNVSSEIIISPVKVEKFYGENKERYKLEDQVKLRMIVINVRPDRPLDAAKKLVGEIQTKLKEGASFSEMATIYSEGSQRAEGGDWGWVGKSVLRKELADVAFSLKPGEGSSAIETPNAVYLMKVEESKVAHLRPVAEVREEIEKVLGTQERERLRKKWIEKLRVKAFVRYF